MHVMYMRIINIMVFLLALPGTGPRVAGGSSGLDLNAMMRQMGSGGGAMGMPSLEDMQAQLSQNPDMMNQMMNSPMMQNLLNNPDVIREMMTSNPQMQAMLDSNPHIRHILNDPAVSLALLCVSLSFHSSDEYSCSSDLILCSAYATNDGDDEKSEYDAGGYASPRLGNESS